MKHFNITTENIRLQMLLLVLK